MITNEELQISGKSYINKDFQTIYPEIIDIFKKLTTIVNPEAMNESDPLIVLLKLLGFIGDKTNYNVDKNILEAYLPSATQETTVRQLLETNGYTKRYYQSATTEISLLYQGTLPTNQSVYLKAFDTLFTDDNNTIIYTLLEDAELINNTDTVTKLVMEGAPKDLTINGNTSIQLSNLDENYRLYLPETMIAQNGIFVKNVESSNWNIRGEDEDGWSQVNNLNLYLPKTKNFKFGFDSNKNLPYIQFPDDIIELIGNGLNVRYFITSGANGNIARGRLTVLNSPSEDNLYYYDENDNPTTTNVVLTDELTNQKLLRIFNYYASTNGENPETINEAYNNFKKTVGTFDTLINCRDFANWLYNYIGTDSYPIVNNIQVGDRRTDTQFYQPIITYNNYGIATDYIYVHGRDSSDYTTPTANTITPFDLTLYPLQQMSNYIVYDNNGTIQSTNYDASFTPSTGLIESEIIDILENTQSIDHTFIRVNDDEPYLYKNYYSLNIMVSTVDKVNDVERKSIINNIKQALFDNFNSRELDYGYELPDTIYDIVLGADTRIKNVSINDPYITTKVMLGSGVEHSLSDNNYSYYIDVVARNVLAGKINMYNYLDTFNFDYTMSSATLISNVTSLTPTFTLTNPSNRELLENQVVQLFSDSFSTSQTATVGVNYYWSGATLTANTLHQISGDEYLYISYTNSDNVIKTYKYTATQIIEISESGSETLIENNAFNVIQPNFALTDTDTYGIINVVVGQGVTLRFNSLTSSQEIQFLKKNEKVFNDKTYYFYWKLSNSDNILFPTGVNTRILGEDEYFMYTDATKSSVEIFGSGTKISRTNLANLSDVSCQLIDDSALVDGDLSVYAGINWISLTFSQTDTLTINQQKILTLIYKDRVTYSGTLTSTLSPLSGTFTYTINGESAVPVTADTLHNYMLRTRLDIVAGPDLPQTLHSGESIAYVGTTSGILSGTFITNYPIQRSGNGVIDTKLSGGEFNIVAYTKTNAPNYNRTWVDKQGDQYRIDFKNLPSNSQSINVNVPIISNVNTKLMIYFNKETTDTTTITYGTTTINLVNGVNMITPTSSTITIAMSRSSATSNSYIILDKVNVVTGLNSAFKFEELEISNLALESIISDISTHSGITFYETCNIPYSKMIDTDDFTKADVMFDKNNVLNKFTLSQIDFANSKIDVLKSSLK